GQPGSLVAEQPPLARDASAVTGEGAIATDHAVARDDDRCRVRAVRGSDGAHCGWSADRRGEVPIGNGLPGWDRADPCPHGLLKCRAAEVERNRIERREVAPKIGAQPGENSFVIALPPRLGTGEAPLDHPLEPRPMFAEAEST